MYQYVIEHIDSKIDELGIFDEIYGLAERVTSVNKDGEVIFSPASYQKDGNLKPISFNIKQSKIYAIRNGEFVLDDVPEEEQHNGCKDMIRIVQPFKYVGLVVRCYEDNEYNKEKIIHDIIAKIYDANIREILDQTKFQDIVLTPTGGGSDAYEVFNEEWEGYEFKIGYDKILFKLELNIQVDLERSCYIQNYCYCG